MYKTNYLWKTLYLGLYEVALVKFSCWSLPVCVRNNKGLPYFVEGTGHTCSLLLWSTQNPSPLCLWHSLPLPMAWQIYVHLSGVSSHHALGVRGGVWWSPPNHKVTVLMPKSNGFECVVPSGMFIWQSLSKHADFISWLYVGGGSV